MRMSSPENFITGRQFLSASFDGNRKIGFIFFCISLILHALSFYGIIFFQGFRLPKPLPPVIQVDLVSFSEEPVIQEAPVKEEILEETETTYFFNVTRCLYAEAYETMGVKQFGYCLSCCRDQPFVEGFNPGITFKRTQTIMEGAAFCDFRFSLDS